jgi:hypothetical protein
MFAALDRMKYPTKLHWLAYLPPPPFYCTNPKCVAKQIMPERYKVMNPVALGGSPSPGIATLFALRLLPIVFASKCYAADFRPLAGLGCSMTPISTAKSTTASSCAGVSG